MATILLAEDHDLVRLGFKSLIEAEAGLSIIAEAKEGETCLSLVETEQPDILIVDLSMPKLSGLAAINELKRAKSSVKIIVLTAAESINVWKEAIQLGVDGLALKSVDKDELIAGIKTVSKGGRFIHSEIANVLSEEAFDMDSVALTKAGLPKKVLSIREKQVIKLVAEGFKTKDIAEQLEISDRTVSKHRENIMTKLKMNSSADLVAYANDIGLLKIGLTEIH